MLSGVWQASEQADQLHRLLDYPGRQAREVLYKSQVIDQTRPGQAPHVLVVIRMVKNRTI